MSRFNYTAILDTGERVTGVLKSQDRHQALKQLIGQGYHPVALEPVEMNGLNAKHIRNLFQRVTTSDLAILTKQLASLLQAGLPMVAALATLRRQSENKQLVRVLAEIEETLLHEGGQLAEALDEHPRVFSPVYRSLVRAGEEGGNLIEVLKDLAKHLGKTAKLKGQVLGAFIYPGFLLLLGATAIFILMAFVIPRFQELFESFGQALPKPTQILIATSGFLSSWWWAVLIGLLMGTMCITMILRRPHVRQRADQALLRLPIVGKMLLKLEVSSIARTLSSLLAGGVGILSALYITGQTVKNRAIRATFSSMIEGVSTGEAFAAVAEKAKVYPPLMVNLIRTGEDTGELPEMLTELSIIYEEEAERAVGGAVKLLEPILIVVMGGVIAAIVAAVMLPVFEANAMVE